MTRDHTGAIEALLDSVGLPSTVDVFAERRIAKLEETLAIVLPAAVRAYFARDPDVALLRDFSNQDHPHAIEALAPAPPEMADGAEEIVGTLVVLMAENQHCAHWAFATGVADDPPVYVTTEHRGRSRWILHNPSFVSFLESTVFDWRPGVFEAQLFGPSLRDAGLGAMQAHFTEGPCTPWWPGGYQYRFSSADVRVSCMDQLTDVCVWIRAESREAMIATVGFLRATGVVSGTPDATNEATEELAAELS